MADTTKLLLAAAAGAAGAALLLSKQDAPLTASGRPAQVIDGTKIAKELRNEVKQAVDAMKSEHGVAPGLAVVIVGERQDSAQYVRMKKKAAKEAGFHSVDVSLPEACTEAEVLDEAAERRAFQEAVSAWRSGAPPDLPSPPKCGGSLLEGDYDEQAEQAAFQEAVNAWRTRGEEPAPRRSSPKKLNTVGRTATDVADDLARQLDAMNAEAGAALRQRRQVLEAAAAAARAEGERLRAAVPLVLDDVDSDSESDAAPQSCRVTEVKASDDADEAAYFVDEGSD